MSPAWGVARPYAAESTTAGAGDRRWCGEYEVEAILGKREGLEQPASAAADGKRRSG